jgi:membrane glycosyltransferase
MTDLTFTHRTPGDARDVTPAGIQPYSVLKRRRLFVGTLNVLTVGALAYGMATAFGLGNGGFALLDTLFFICILIGLPWTVMGFWNAIIGLWLLHGRRDGLQAVAPFWGGNEVRAPLRSRTAILMTLRNEDPERAMSRLMIVRESLDATGEGAAFDYFVLSDTSHADVAAAEERWCEAWTLRFGADARLTYRRREVNEGFKAGNVRDFLNRWGDDYEFFLPLDADSLMAGETIVKLVRVAQALPRLGILQSLVVGTPSRSAFARIFQFGMRHGMRSYTMGSAWWTGDCGPFWGHNAIVRTKPFREHGVLPVLPGKAPLGGHVLSHDQIEAAYIRRGGYEVRVVPVEDASYEDNPPTLLDFTKRDLRWCQGNMQYWRFIVEPGLKPLSRFQIIAAIFMYLSAAAWMVMVGLGAVIAVAGGFQAMNPDLSVVLFFTMVGMSLTPVVAGLLDVALTKGGAARYGGRLRLAFGSLVQFLFALMLMPVTALRLTIFMTSLLFGRAVAWNGQQRDAYHLSWATAARGLWPQLLAGIALLGVLWTYAPGAIIWAAPMLAGFLFAIPFAVFTASPQAGELLARLRLCAIPEEFDTPPVLAALDRGTKANDDGALPAASRDPAMAAAA